MESILSPLDLANIVYNSGSALRICEKEVKESFRLC